MVATRDRKAEKEHSRMIDLNDTDEMTELHGADIPRVDLVGKAANGLRFLLMKSADDSPNLLGADQVRELIKQSEGDDMTDKTAPTAVIKDDLDPSVVLAEPEETPTGSSTTEPGSPAWEAVDAATARKWTSILARAKNALQVLSDRELVESIDGDGDSAEASYDLVEAAAAVDHAIGILACYGAGEQSEVDLAEEGGLNLIGKALAGFDSDALDTVEGFGPIVKAGRSLSAANESALRAASDSIQKVLASLPAAPDAEPITKEATVAAAPKSITVNVLPVVDQEAMAKAVADARAGMEAEPVVKADPLVAVFNAKGDLVGVVKPGAIQPIDGGAAPESSEDPAEEATETPAEESAEPGSDELQAAPAAAVGTPTNAPEPVTTDPVEKADIASVIKEALDVQAESFSAIVKGLQDDIEFLKAPAPSKVHANGASLPDPRHMRGQDQGGQPAVTSEDLRKSLATATTSEQRESISAAMQKQAADALTAIRAGAHQNPMHHTA
jgi:hypothetical protein